MTTWLGISGGVSPARLQGLNQIRSSGQVGNLHRREDAIKDLSKAKQIDKTAAEEELRKQREGERLALLDWLHAGANKDAYKADHFPLTADGATRPIAECEQFFADRLKRTVAMTDMTPPRSWLP